MPIAVADGGDEAGGEFVCALDGRGVAHSVGDVGGGVLVEEDVVEEEVAAADQGTGDEREFAQRADAPSSKLSCSRTDS